MFTQDGTYWPSYLGMESVGRPVLGKEFSNMVLREGEVRRIILPTDPQSQSKRFIEYVVDVKHGDKGGSFCTTPYNGCLISNLFGGVADFFRYTLRTDDGTGASIDNRIGVGAKVYVLCVNGFTSHAIILGGRRDFDLDDSEKDIPADGHNLKFRFNGVSAGINKYGEFSLSFGSATDVKGKPNPVNQDTHPTTLLIDKTGSLKISTKSDNQYWHIDHANKKTLTLADTELNETVNGTWNQTVGGAVNLDWGDSSAIAIKKSWTVTCSDAVTYNIDKTFTIKSAGVKVGAATDKWPLFSTYRQEEQQLHTKLSTGLTTLSTQIGVAGGALLAASGMLSVPIGGAIAAAVPIQLAGQSLMQCVSAIANMMSAIQSFEAQAARYLSKKNLSD